MKFRLPLLEVVREGIMSTVSKLIHGDCLNEMKNIPDKSVDMIFTDLPYGTTQNSWDSIVDLDEMWCHYERIIKENGAILLFAQAPFDKILACSNMKLFRYEWIWEKTLATGFLNSKKMPLKAHENILVFYKKLPTYNPIKTTGQRKVSKKASKDKAIKSSNYGKQYFRSDYDSTERYPRSVLTFKSDKQKNYLHPTQKPIELIKYMINTYTNIGDTVLDSCMGSGTVPTACVELKRYFIGIELQLEYFKIAENRVNLTAGNAGLFSRTI